MNISVCMEYWAVGGAERFWQRLARKLPQYRWFFTTKVSPDADLVFYSNSDKFYWQAKELNKPTIMRLTGQRSNKLPQHADLKAVVCSSAAGYELSEHPHKVLIYNGIDFEHLKTIKPIPCDLLYGCARCGTGQAPEVAIKYALANNRHLTITGARQHLAENTYDLLKAQYPQVEWTGLLEEDVMLGYIKGCNTAIMPTSAHGVSNFLLECVALDKPIINLGGVEILKKEDIDINTTAQKYDAVIKASLET